MQLYDRPDRFYADDLNDEEAEAAMVASYLERHCGDAGDGKPPSELCARLLQQQNGEWAGALAPLSASRGRAGLTKCKPWAARFGACPSQT